jgi:hypothetical protein
MEVDLGLHHSHPNPPGRQDVSGLFGPIQVSIDAFHADVEAQPPSILDQYQDAGVSMKQPASCLAWVPRTQKYVACTAVNHGATRFRIRNDP